MANKVLNGPFVGKTKAELLVLLATWQDKFSAGGADITGASIGGQSFSKTPGLSPGEMIATIQAALAQVDPDYLAPSQTIYGRMTSPDLMAGYPGAPWQ